jgi:adhesin/invasin
VAWIGPDKVALFGKTAAALALGTLSLIFFAVVGPASSARSAEWWDGPSISQQTASLVLTPAIDVNPVGTSHTVTATLTEGTEPVPAIVIRFTVTGTGASASGSCTTNASGQCSFSYPGPFTPGTDDINAYADMNNDGVESLGVEPHGFAIKHWNPAQLVLTPAIDVNPVGTSHTVTATLTFFGPPDFTGAEPVPGIVVRFTVTGVAPASGQCTTNGSGQCSFSYPGPFTPSTDAINAYADMDADGVEDVGEPQTFAQKNWNPAQLVLTPAIDVNPVGTSHTVTATLTFFGPPSFTGTEPVPGIVIRFTVTGPGATTGSCTTNASGQCSFSYPGPLTPGTDAINAYADMDADGVQDVGEPQTFAQKNWNPAQLVLTPAIDVNPVGTSHTVTATLTFFGPPDFTGAEPVPGIVIRFTVTGVAPASGQCTTNGSGQCSFSYPGPFTPSTDDINAYADMNNDGVESLGVEPHGFAIKHWNPAQLVLTPAIDVNPVGTSHTVTATLTFFGPPSFTGTEPVPGIVIRFTVTGPGATTGSCTTDGSGQCSFTYSATTAGADTITAYADMNANGVNNPGEPSGAATKTWTPGEPATLVLTPAAATNAVGTSHTVSATVRDVSGNPVPGVTVRFTVVGAVATFATPSSGSGVTNAAGQTTFTFTAALPGVNPIHAFADFNPNNGSQDLGEPFGDATKIWTLPVGTALCEIKITGGGWITAINEDQATFGGNARSDAAGNASGNEEYQDQGPAQPMNVKSSDILAITCTSDFKTANIYGTATVNGSGPFAFRISATDNGEHGTRFDVYGIIVSNGYVSGDKVLEGGNIQIHKLP